MIGGSASGIRFKEEGSEDVYWKRRWICTEGFLLEWLDFRLAGEIGFFDLPNLSFGTETEICQSSVLRALTFGIRMIRT